MGVWVEVAPGRQRLVQDEPQGVARSSDRHTIGGIVVKNYEHLALQFPRYVPKEHGPKSPYPHLVETRPGSGRYIGAFKSRREVDEYSAKHGVEWDK